MSITIDEVMELHKQGKNAFKQRNAEMQIDEYILDGKHDEAFGFPKPLTKKGEVRIVAGDAYDLHNDAVAIITSLKRTVKVWPEKGTKALDEKASQAEKFIEGIFQINNYRWKMDLIEACINAACAIGWGVMHYSWDNNAEAHDGTYNELPIIMKPIDARYYYPIARDIYGRHSKVIYAPRMKRWEAVAQAKAMGLNLSWGDTRDKGENDNVDWIDCWYWDEPKAKKDGDQRALVPWNTIVVDEKRCKPAVEMPDYEGIPYCELLALNGLGRDSNSISRSLIYAIRDALKNKELSLSIQMSQMFMQTLGALLLETPRGSTATQLIQREMGAVIPVPVGTKVTPLVDVVPSPLASEQADRWERQIAKSAFSPGSPHPGTSDSLYADMAAMGKVKLNRVIKNLELFLSEMTTGMMGLAARKADGNKIRVYGYHKGDTFDFGVDTKDLGRLRFGWEISSDLPGDKFRRETIGMQKLNIPRENRLGLSNRTIIERDFGIEQPEDEFERSVTELTVQQLLPVMIDAKLREMLSELAPELAAMIAKERKAPQPEAPLVVDPGVVPPMQQGQPPAGTGPPPGGGMQPPPQQGRGLQIPPFKVPIDKSKIQR